MIDSNIDLNGDIWSVAPLSRTKRYNDLMVGSCLRVLGLYLLVDSTLVGTGELVLGAKVTSLRQNLGGVEG